MKKLIITITFLLISSYSYAGIFGSLFGGGFKNEIKTGLNDIKAGINDSNINLKGLIKVNANIDTKLNLQAQANAKVLAGIDKSMTTNAGRDVNITNDPMLLKYIIGGLLGIVMF